MSDLDTLNSTPLDEIRPDTAVISRVLKRGQTTVEVASFGSSI